MRINRVFCIYDLIADEVLGLMWNTNRVEAAVRRFTEVCADNRTDPAKHPDDFALVEIVPAWKYDTTTDSGEAKPLAFFNAEIVMTARAAIAAIAPSGPTLHTGTEN